MSGATYAVRLRDLEQRVDELKDQIRRSHTRLALLSDTIIGGGAAGSRSEVEFKNEMSSAFQLTQALFVIDGQVQYNRAGRRRRARRIRRNPHLQRLGSARAITPSRSRSRSRATATASSRTCAATSSR